MEHTAFFVSISGSCESGDFGVIENIYCRYSFHYGPDWTALSGNPETGLSQTSRASRHDEGVVWNFPIDISFKSTNIQGWPRIALSVYGIDFLGRDVVRGYGSLLVPLTSGQHIIDVDMFVPVAASMFNQFFSWLVGNPPEFFDTKFVCQGEGREVTRVQRSGTVRVKLNVTTKGMAAVGYSVRDNPVVSTQASKA